MRGVKKALFSYDPEKVGSSRQICKYDPDQDTYSPIQTVGDSQAKTLTAIISTTQGLYAIRGSEPLQLISVVAFFVVMFVVIAQQFF